MQIIRICNVHPRLQTFFRRCLLHCFAVGLTGDDGTNTFLQEAVGRMISEKETIVVSICRRSDFIKP